MNEAMNELSPDSKDFTPAGMKSEIVAQSLVADELSPDSKDFTPAGMKSEIVAQSLVADDSLNNQAKIFTPVFIPAKPNEALNKQISPFARVFTPPPPTLPLPNIPQASIYTKQSNALFVPKIASLSLPFSPPPSFTPRAKEFIPAAPPWKFSQSAVPIPTLIPPTLTTSPPTLTYANNQEYEHRVDTSGEYYFEPRNPPVKLGDSTIGEWDFEKMHYAPQKIVKIPNHLATEGGKQQGERHPDSDSALRRLDEVQPEHARVYVPNRVGYVLNQRTVFSPQSSESSEGWTQTFNTFSPTITPITPTPTPTQLKSKRAPVASVKKPPNDSLRITELPRNYSDRQVRSFFTMFSNHSPPVTISNISHEVSERSERL